MEGCRSGCLMRPIEAVREESSLLLWPCKQHGFVEATSREEPKLSRVRTSFPLAEKGSGKLVPSFLLRYSTPLSNFNHPKSSQNTNNVSSKQRLFDSEQSSANAQSIRLSGPRDRRRRQRPCRSPQRSTTLVCRHVVTRCTPPPGSPRPRLYYVVSTRRTRLDPNSTRLALGHRSAAIGEGLPISPMPIIF